MLKHVNNTDSDLRLMKLTTPIEVYIEKLQKTEPYQFAKIGLVYTKFEQEYWKGRFWIWIERGQDISHKCITLKEAGLL